MWTGIEWGSSTWDLEPVLLSTTGSSYDRCVPFALLTTESSKENSSPRDLVAEGLHSAKQVLQWEGGQRPEGCPGEGVCLPYVCLQVCWWGCQNGGWLLVSCVCLHMRVRCWLVCSLVWVWMYVIHGGQEAPLWEECLAMYRYQTTRGTDPLRWGRGESGFTECRHHSDNWVLPQTLCKITPPPVEPKMRTDGMGCKKAGLKGSEKGLTSYQLGHFFLCIIMLLSVSKNIQFYSSNLAISIYSYWKSNSKLVSLSIFVLSSLSPNRPIEFWVQEFKGNFFLSIWLKFCMITHILILGQFPPTPAPNSRHWKGLVETSFHNHHN